MKTKFLTLVFLLMSSAGVFAQADIKPVQQDVAKVKRVGYLMTTSVDSRIVEQAWKKKLAQYGRVLSERGGVYKVEYAKVPFSDKNVLIVSQIDSRSKGTTLFLSVDMGSYEYASSTNNYGREVEAILQDFHKEVDYESQVSDADKTLKEATDKQKDVVRKSERNLRNLKDNRAEKIKLFKRLEENEKELAQLQADSVRLRSEVEQASNLLEDQKKNNESVKSRKP
ncbi:hypothetical protein BWI96_06720 [Siphonobacter sp. SORGH_AS_0500]|uniref:hypothetical protein n=1 Tax=Siphonobacter sp. SORGH_AS_0500 TaxID=1864824 RepID=UPI000CAE8AB9|nr:hypothetical protein [Siphonobacter sp. SORGH_AS_0500]PKK37548.1 hypothetical protein BWI96_06720 [Siphonobacter sp. SORGH_AS_0500]